MIHLLKLAAIFCFTLIGFSQSSKLLDLERTINQDIFTNYDPTIRPPGKNGTGPVLVEVNTYIRSIKNIDDLKMHYDVQLTFRQMWQDNRLGFDTQTKDLKYISLSDPSCMWTPDFFFSNEEEGHFHNMMTPNILIRIFPDGKILYSVRVSLRLACPADMKNYPMDDRVCSIVGASYGYTTDGIVFIWKSKYPVQITRNLHLRKFTLKSFFTDYCTSRTNTGEYSCLKIDLVFSRVLYRYLQRAYMPTTALVILSWIVFWLNPRCSLIRLGIWISSLVSTLVVNITITSNTPEVPYATALDVWMGTCVCFVLAVVIEICLVANVLKSDEGLLSLQNQLESDDSENDKHSMRMEDGKRSLMSSYTSFPLKWLNKYNTKAQRIDVISRFLFPSVFIFFNFIYWLIYTVGQRKIYKH